MHLEKELPNHFRKPFFMDSSRHWMGIGKTINYQFKIFLIINQLMSSSESMEALSDPLPRIYSCFCDKIFTTYPGIYLHLKSKHANLFQKYKKLKITKLFKKVKGQNNTQVFKLDKLNEKEVSNNNNYLKKIKQNNKKINTNREENIVFLEDESDAEGKKKQPNYAFNSPLDQRASDQSIHNRAYPQQPRDLLERMGGNPYYPPMHNPFFSFPYYPPPPHAFPPYPMAPPTEPTIKIILQDFLSNCGSNPLNDKAEVRDTLYKLMIHIDQNYASINDPRAKDAILLSYCDVFSAKFIGPFLNDYILQRAALITENETVSSAIVAEVDYLKQFAAFLRERRLIKSDHRPQEPFEIEIITTSKVRDSIPFLEKRQMIYD